MSFDAILKGMQKASKEEKHGRIYRAGDITLSSTIPYGVLTGIPRLDLAMGKPGLPAGKVVEFFGFPMVGKTTAALHTIAQAQRAGGAGVFIDAEFSWDETRAIELGVDVNKNFVIAEADTVEAIFRHIGRAIEQVIEAEFDKPFVIVIDSITGVPTELEQEKEFGAVARVGEDARAIRNGMRKIVSLVAKSKVLLIFVNHAISKIATSKYAKQSESSGGYAIKFYSSLRCNFSGSANIMASDKTTRLGQKVNIKIEKLKNSRLDFPEITEICLMGKNGIDLNDELFEAGRASGMIENVNQKVYKMNDREFSRVDWNQLVEEFGGSNAMYDHFIHFCLESGKMTEWNEKIYG